MLKVELDKREQKVSWCIIIIIDHEYSASSRYTLSLNDAEIFSTTTLRKRYGLSTLLNGIANSSCDACGRK